MSQVVVVETVVASGTPEEIERLVAVPLERALHELAGTTEIRSRSIHGSCRVEVSYARTPASEVVKQVEFTALAEWAKFSALASKPVVSVSASAIP